MAPGILGTNRREAELALADAIAALKTSGNVQTEADDVFCRTVAGSGTLQNGLRLWDYAAPGQCEKHMAWLGVLRRMAQG